MSSREIKYLVPAMVDLYYKFKDECDRQNLDFIVTCTLRLRAEQKALVAQKKSKTMNSKHLTGKAFDFAVIKNGKISWDKKDYLPYVKIGESIGLKSGARFGDNPKTPEIEGWDMGHLELKED